MRVKVQLDPWKVAQARANALLKEFGMTRAEELEGSRRLWRHVRRVARLREGQRLGRGSPGRDGDARDAE